MGKLLLRLLIFYFQGTAIVCLGYGIVAGCITWLSGDAFLGFQYCMYGAACFGMLFLTGKWINDFFVKPGSGLVNLLLSLLIFNFQGAAIVYLGFGIVAGIGTWLSGNPFLGFQYCMYGAACFGMLFLTGKWINDFFVKPGSGHRIIHLR